MKGNPVGIIDADVRLAFGQRYERSTGAQGLIEFVAVASNRFGFHRLKPASEKDGSSTWPTAPRRLSVGAPHRSMDSGTAGKTRCSRKSSSGNSSMPKLYSTVRPSGSST